MPALIGVFVFILFVTLLVMIGMPGLIRARVNAVQLLVKEGRYEEAVSRFPMIINEGLPFIPNMVYL